MAAGHLKQGRLERSSNKVSVLFLSFSWRKSHRSFKPIVPWKQILSFSFSNSGWVYSKSELSPIPSAGAHAENICTWTGERSGYKPRSLPIHIGNRKPKVQRPPLTLQCNQRGTFHTQHRENGSHQLLRLARFQASFTCIIPFKVREHPKSQGITICVLEVKELRRRDVTWLAPTATQSHWQSQSHQWLDSSTQEPMNRRPDLSPNLFLLHFSSELHGLFSSSYFVIYWELVSCTLKTQMRGPWRESELSDIIIRLYK